MSIEITQILLPYGPTREYRVWGAASFEEVMERFPKCGDQLQKPWDNFRVIRVTVSVGDLNDSIGVRLTFQEDGK